MLRRSSRNQVLRAKSEEEMTKECKLFAKSSKNPEEIVFSPDDTTTKKAPKKADHKAELKEIMNRLSKLVKAYEEKYNDSDPRKSPDKVRPSEEVKPLKIPSFFNSFWNVFWMWTLVLSLIYIFMFNPPSELGLKLVHLLFQDIE